jgi:hypothetical protein
MPAHRNVSARSEAGVRKPPGKEPRWATWAVAVYGDLTAGRLSRVMRQSVVKSAGSKLQRSRPRHCRFREGDFGVTGGMARVFSGPKAVGLRHRRRHPPAGNEVAAVVMVSQSWPGNHPGAGRAVWR